MSNTPLHPKAESQCLAYRPAEAAKMLGVSRRYLTLAAQRGELKPLRLSARLTLYPRIELERWLADRAGEASR